MKQRWNEMVYYENIESWVVLWSDCEGYKVRCGDWLEIHLGEGRKLTCRIELGRNWYIIVGFKEVKFYLKQNETYQVNIL